MSECCINFPNCHCSRYKGSSSKPAAPKRTYVNPTEHAAFIKLDETTEAFAQTRAAIENMKQFQRDAIQARRDLNGALKHLEVQTNAFTRERATVRDLEARLAESERVKTSSEKFLYEASHDRDGWRKKFDEERTKSAALVEALKQILNCKHWDAGAVSTIAKEALAKWEKK